MELKLDAKSEAALISEHLLRSAARLISAVDQPGLVDGLCQALTRITPHILLAWTWFGRGESSRITPQIIAGPAADYARSLVIEDTPLTRTGPALRALRGQSSAPMSISASSPYEPWQQAALIHGIRSSLALPLRSSDGKHGVFVLYAGRDGYFDEVGVPLFEALAELFGALLSAAGDRSALRSAAQSDALTGLGNRRRLESLERAVHRATEDAPKCSVLLLDLDHFKQVNDQHGHHTGDQILREVADHLQSLVRTNDTVLRWGGEEFLICLPSTGLDQAIAVAEKIRAAVQWRRYAYGLVSTSISVGVAELQAGTPLAQSIQSADSHLYAAKRLGRNRVCSARD